MQTRLLTFPFAELLKLREIARDAWEQEVRPLYAHRKTGPGYWLVGDSGVYLMHNGKPADAESQPVVYSRECDPSTNKRWQQTKRETFGGDDGAEFVAAETIDAVLDKGADLVVDFTDRHVAFYAATELVQ